jgi:hypothetical protein
VFALTAVESISAPVQFQRVSGGFSVKFSRTRLWRHGTARG